MTRYSVQHFRAAVLCMYLRIAVIVTLPMSILNFLFVKTPDKGLAPFAFAMFALWLQWRTRRDSEESLRYAGGFLLALLLLMLYGAYTGNEQLHQEVWIMIFPLALSPIVAMRERVVWGVTGAVSLGAVVMMRPDPLSPLSSFVLISAYLTLGFVAKMLVRHNEQNIERLAHLTIIDPLTKAYNRSCLKDVMMSEINRCRRSGQPLTIIMLDIDRFKMLNDNYGHLFGDSVLEQVADALKQAAQRAGDYVFRYGGEEFCILTSGLNRDEAKQFAEKLRGSISALGIENQLAASSRVTASAGFWCVGDLSEVMPSTLLLNADNALYRAKEAGRDTVVDFDEIAACTEVKPVQAQGALA